MKLIPSTWRSLKSVFSPSPPSGGGEGRGENAPEKNLSLGTPGLESARSAGCQPAVSQVANLHGRASGADVGVAQDTRPTIARPADWPSAKRQAGSLRYAQAALRRPQVHGEEIRPLYSESHHSAPLPLRRSEGEAAWGPDSNQRFRDAGCALFLAWLVGAGSAGAAPITALAFSPDGAVLVANGDRRLDLRSPKDAAVQRSIACELAKITTLAFAPDGRWLAVGGGEPGVRGEGLLLSWPEGKVLHRFARHNDVLTCLAWDRAGTRLAVAASDHVARLWKVSDKTEPAALFTLAGHAGSVLAIAFSPSGESIVTASADRSLKVWSAAEGRLLRSFSQHTEAVHALAFRPVSVAEQGGPALCASAGEDRTVRVWQPEIGRMVRIVRQHEGAILALAWAHDGSSLFSAGQEGVIRRLDGASDRVLAGWRAHEDWIYALAVSADGATLASGDWAGTVRVHPAAPIGLAK